ncbi:glutathione S-transferase A-like [Gigantopelta aegis]|uniref:glutathione S-transferase A-like n=1 Tax=Gigantopelta aegis TaxID=1735272 RepID=UPI001B888443|nr:glutathione S-transferase A-like [Gigantopelta aegis]
MAAENMFLYWGSGSIPCWKAMLALEEKGFGGYKNKLCSFQKKEHKSEEILALNPRGQLPTFKDGNIVVNESNAIIEYLESAYPNNGAKLLPDDKAERAKVYQVFHELANLHDIFVEKLIHYKMFTPKDKIDENLLKEKYEACRKEMTVWDEKLKKGGANAFIAGTSFTMADCTLYPYLAIAKRLGLKMEKWSALDAYYNRLTDRPSVKTTWPPHWKETPGDTAVLGDI